MRTRAGSVAIRLVTAGLAFGLGVGVALAPAVPANAQDGQWWHAVWRMSEVWQITDGSGVTVAVVDSGVDASIPDLGGAVLPGADLTGGGTRGQVDSSDDGHGTGMASLIASRGTTTGVVGVAPGAAILPIDSGDTNQGAIVQLPESIRFAVDNGATVINVSQGAYVTGPEPCPQAMAEAIRYAVERDAIVVTSTENEPSDKPGYPESCPGVLTVGALTSDLEPWERSGRTGYVDVAAPGVGISAVIPGGTVIQVDGTSNSTALVSGVVALVRAQFPDASAYEVVGRILATVEDVPPAGQDTATGYGMVRPYEALTASVPASAPNPIFDPVTDGSQVDEPDQFVPEPFPTVAPDALGSGPGLADSIPFIPILLMFLLVGPAVVVVVVVFARRRGRSATSPPAAGLAASGHAPAGPPGYGVVPSAAGPGVAPQASPYPHGIPPAGGLPPPHPESTAPPPGHG
jgi:type VII secretion-associated serine protease mycosin